MLGLKSFRTAEVLISGIELAEKIKKKQFQISGPTATMPEVWQAALAQFRIRTRAGERMLRTKGPRRARKEPPKKTRS